MRTPLIASGSAAGEYLLGLFISRDDSVCFKEADRQERNVLEGFYISWCAAQEITELPVWQVVFILKPEDFKRGFYELLVG